MAEPIKVSSQKHPSFYIETITRELETSDVVELSGLGTGLSPFSPPFPPAFWRAA